MKGKYYYYGEFGFFNVYAIPAIETFYERNPNEKLKICTYAEYGMILKNYFPSIEINSIDWVFNEAMRQMHY